VKKRNFSSIGAIEKRIQKSSKDIANKVVGESYYLWDSVLSSHPFSFLKAVEIGLFEKHRSSTGLQCGMKIYGRDNKRA